MPNGYPHQGWKAFHTRNEWLKGASLTKEKLFIPASMGNPDLFKTAENVLGEVKDQRWIDASTGQLEIKFFLYNTQRRMLSRITYQINLCALPPPAAAAALRLLRLRLRLIRSLSGDLRAHCRAASSPGH